jgi:hypothetical protein
LIRDFGLKLDASVTFGPPARGCAEAMGETGCEYKYVLMPLGI